MDYATRRMQCGICMGWTFAKLWIWAAIASRELSMPTIITATRYASTWWRLTEGWIRASQLG